MQQFLSKMTNVTSDIPVLNFVLNWISVMILNMDSSHQTHYWRNLVAQSVAKLRRLLLVNGLKSGTSSPSIFLNKMTMRVVFHSVRF